jgi:putative transposase
MIEYKARRAGLPVVLVDPRDTSRTCSACGFCDPRNRKSQSRFQCSECGFESNADLNAASNIAFKARGVVTRPNDGVLPERGILDVPLGIATVKAPGFSSGG